MTPLVAVLITLLFVLSITCLFFAAAYYQTKLRVEERQWWVEYWRDEALRQEELIHRYIDDHTLGPRKERPQA